MDEDLNLQLGRGLVPDFGDFIEGQLPGEHHPFGPHPVKFPGGPVVDDPGLGGDVDFCPRDHLPQQREHPEVSDNKGIHPGVRRPPQEGGQAVKFIVPGEGVAGEVDPFPHPVGKGAGPFQRRQVKTRRRRPHPVGGRAEVDGVGPVPQGSLQPLKIPRRGKDFHLLVQI